MALSTRCQPPAWLFAAGSGETDGTGEVIGLLVRGGQGRAVCVVDQLSSDLGFWAGLVPGGGR
jgi:hypothetical protein